MIEAEICMCDANANARGARCKMQDATGWGGACNVQPTKSARQCAWRYLHPGALSLAISLNELVPTGIINKAQQEYLNPTAGPTPKLTTIDAPGALSPVSSRES